MQLGALTSPGEYSHPWDCAASGLRSSGLTGPLHKQPGAARMGFPALLASGHEGSWEYGGYLMGGGSWDRWECGPAIG